MSAPPYMQVWIADWTADVQHLSCEQDGAYWRLIRAMWRNHGELSNCPRKLALIVGLSVKKWTAISAEVLAFFDDDGTVLTHGKLTKTIISVREKSSKRSAAGELGGAAKALKSNKPPLANATILPEQTAGISDVRCHKEEGADDSAREIVDDWPDGSAQDHADRLCAEANTVHLDKSREGGLTVSAGRIHAWRRDGASWERDVRPVVLGIAGRAKAPIKTWAYFDRAVAEAKANNNRAMPEGDQHGNGTGPGRSRRDDDIHAMLEGARQAVDERNAELSGGGRIDRRVS